MDKTFKGGNVLWITVSIISLLCALGLLFFMLQEKNKRIVTEQRLSETEKAKRGVEIKLEHLQLESIQLREQAQILAKELEQEKKDQQASLAAIEKKDTRINGLESNLVNEKKQRATLANSLAKLRENYDSVEERLEEANLKIKELSGHLEKFSGKGGVALKRIVVKPKKKLSAKVLVVNREFHFVVIDLGRKDGIMAGEELIVYQDSKEVGKVQVEKIYDAMSTAAILSGSQEQKITEDSIVKSF